MSTSKDILFNSFLKLILSASIASIGIPTFLLSATICATSTKAATASPKSNQGDAKSQAQLTGTGVPANPGTKDSQAPFVVNQSALVFVRATPAALSKAMEDFRKQYSAEDMGEAGSDIAYYEMSASKFAKKKNQAVINTDSAEVVFKKKNGGEFRLKNTINHTASEIYMFDGTNDPQKINDIATFDNGREYNRYFGKPGKKK